MAFVPRELLVWQGEATSTNLRSGAGGAQGQESRIAAGILARIHGNMAKAVTLKDEAWAQQLVDPGDQHFWGLLSVHTKKAR